MLHPSTIAAALCWVRHAQRAGARFDVEAKAAQALAFCAERDARGFALPSALDGTSRHQTALDGLAAALDAGHGRPVLLRLSVCRIGEGAGVPHVIASAPRGALGHLRLKHNGWALPLLPHGLAAFALSVTGGTPGKPTRGCTIALARIAEALEAVQQADRTASLSAPRAWGRSPAAA